MFLSETVQNARPKTTAKISFISWEFGIYVESVIQSVSWDRLPEIQNAYVDIRTRKLPDR
jgi:hypothetical protein